MFKKEDIAQMATEAGFKLFGEKIVAADNASSGLATKSVEKLVEIVHSRSQSLYYEMRIASQGLLAQIKSELDVFGGHNYQDADPAYVAAYRKLDRLTRPLPEIEGNAGNVMIELAALREQRTKALEFTQDTLLLLEKISKFVNDECPVHLVEQAEEMVEEGRRMTFTETPEVDAIFTSLDQNWVTHQEMIALRRECESRQAQIDSLMLEFCPDEMTPAQLQTWADHQVPVKDDEILKLSGNMIEIKIEDKPREFPSQEDIIAKRKCMVADREILPIEEMANRMSLEVKELTGLVNKGYLFALDLEDVQYFPSFFACQRVSRDELMRVCKELEAIDPWEKLQFFTRRNSALGRSSPIDCLRHFKLNDVLKAARAFAE